MPYFFKMAIFVFLNSHFRAWKIIQIQFVDQKLYLEALSKLQLMKDISSFSKFNKPKWPFGGMVANSTNGGKFYTILPII